MYVLDMVHPRGVLFQGKWMRHIAANEAGTFETFMLAVGGLRMASSSVNVMLKHIPTVLWIQLCP